MGEKSQIVTGDALSVLRRISDNYIDCCVTSPPYYGLRDYGEAGQIGLEKSVDEYIYNLVGVFREVRRALRPDGTLWINIADTYSQSKKLGGYIKKKELCLVPYRLMLELQKDGWYVRQDIIWNKPNAMPESVRDRCTKSHEYIFLLSKSEKYHFDYEAIREPAVGFDNRPPAGSRGAETPNSRRRKGNAKTFRGGGVYTGGQSFKNSEQTERESHGNTGNETGLRNRRSVWNVATQGYSKAHFATFPEKLIEPCILAGCRPGGVVLDPFLGSGTTAAVSARTGREYIGIDINPEYIELAKERIAEAGERGTAHEKTEKEIYCRS